MKHKLYRLWKTLIGFMIATMGCVLFANGVIYIYEIIGLSRVEKELISNLGYYDRIGFVSCEFAFLIGMVFITLGAYIIYSGAKVAGRLGIWKSLKKTNRKTHIV